MELVDVVDSKSTAGDSVPVRVRSPAPRRSKLCIACSDFFQKSERAHAAAPPLQTEPAALGFGLVFFDESHKFCIATRTKTKLTCLNKSVLFWIPLSLVAPSFGISMLGVGKAATAQFSAAGQKGRFGSFTESALKTSIFIIPLISL